MDASGGGDHVLHEFELGSAGTVRASIGTYRGKQRIDLRLWVEPMDVPGSALIPTPMGLNVPIEYADELLECVQAINAAVRPA